MYQIDFRNPIHIHFIGIGGISMSGFAQLLHSIGFTISGSDSKKSKITKHLEQLGINIVYQQTASNITPNIDLVVYTAAINEDNPELTAAKEQHLPIIDRAEMVGQIMKNYKTPIAISGTHGKTTTTSMISHIFLAANLDPTISVGGILKAIDGNLRIGKSENFITEACEYTNSFLKFCPKIGIILNIEEDHLDFFHDISEIRHSFQLFAKKLPKDGLLIINGEIENFSSIIKNLECKLLTYGIDDGIHPYNISAKNISYNEIGFGEYDLIENGTFMEHISLNVVGLHNISNSLAAVALARYLNIPMEIIKNGLMTFKGTDRRFEYKGTINDIVIIDDYAHHPTEITATLKAAQKYPHKSIWCVFQPHTYTRTKAFLNEFAQALSYADKIILTDIYAAREKDPGDISSRDLYKKLKEKQKDVYYISDFDQIRHFLLENCIKEDLIITMGAGDIVTVGEALLQK